MTKDNNKEQYIDYDFILGKGIADYSDGDIVVIEKIGAKPIEGTVKLDMVLMIYCLKGRIQGEINGKTWLAEEGDVVICLPNSYLSNYMMTPDFDSRIIGLSYDAIRNNIPMTKDASRPAVVCVEESDNSSRRRASGSYQQVLFYNRPQD